MADADLKNPGRAAADVRLTVYDRDAVVAAVNAFGGDIVRPGRIPFGSEDVNEATILIQRLVGTREARKKLLARAGITADTKDDFRLAIYRDNGQLVLLKGREDRARNVIVLDASLPLSGLGGATGFEVQTIRNIAEGANFKKMPNPIEVPLNHIKPHDHSMAPKIDQRIKSYDVDLDSEDATKLKSLVTLLAKADQAVAGATPVLASNAKLPRPHQGQETGRGEART